jgi:hypothetical protein
MTFTEFFNTQAETAAAFRIGVSVCCGNCGKTSRPGGTEAQAVALALGTGWLVRIRDGYHLVNTADAETIRQMVDAVFCPACKPEWTP